MDETLQDAQAARTAPRGVMGAGYGRHAEAQRAGADAALDLLDRAVAAVAAAPVGGAAPVKDPRRFRLADLGCADGANSLSPMHRAVSGLRRAHEGADVLVTHTDIPGNDFNALFERLAGPGSHTALPGVYAAARCGSFYNRLFAAAEIDLAWSSIAVHWLSRLPGPLTGHIYGPSTSGPVRAALARRAREDWHAFLRHRAVELAPGGQLVVVGGAAAEDGSSGAEGIMDMAAAELETMLRRGLLSEDTWAEMAIPTWNRTESEYLEAFTTPGVGGLLTLEESDFLALPDAAYERFLRNGDPEAYGQEVAASFLVAFGPSLFGSGARHVAERFETGLAERVRRDPEAAETHWRIRLIRATRTDAPSPRPA
ncbi:hypothetical protein [Streptomyces sp. NPDC005805]|uniref:hypothetical protein n=1 Tax=Streptomyces sp. NPDC005805 TaxID=3157068 RepID=UPI0033F9D191